MDLPNDLIHDIIKLTRPVYYFNLYCVCNRFRKCLKYVYDHHIILKSNHDILSSLIYTNTIYDSNLIISLLSYDYSVSPQYSCKIYESSLVRAVLQINVIYEYKALEQILTAACYYEDLQIIKHVEKLNDITNHCFVLLKKLDEGDLFNYLFEKLLSHGYPNHLSRMAERTYVKGQTNLFKQVVETGRITDVSNLLPVLINHGDVELTSLLLYSNQITFSYKQLRSYPSYGDMGTLLNKFKK